jgi:hypothetical protein
LSDEQDCQEQEAQRRAHVPENFENHGVLTTSDGRAGRSIAAAARIIIRDERALR